MGVNVSNWGLARAVSSGGERLGVNTMGVVSGTGIAVVVARRLQEGDIGGHLRNAFDAFPYPEMAERVWDTWYIEGGKPEGKPYKPIPMVNFKLRPDVAELIVCANFVEVWLAKEGHHGPIGINYLEKIQAPRLPEILGAMIAGVDVILMGAGIPHQVPGVLDSFAAYKPASYYLDVEGAESREFAMVLDPASIVPERFIERLGRPAFFAIASTNVLAQYLSDPRRTTGRVDGFIMEGPTAGGHNAPPRDRSKFNERGEPIYGEKDVVDLRKMRQLGMPFWVAGSYAHPEKLAEALAEGATGCQFGSIFALCQESGLRDDLKRETKRLAFRRQLDVVADPKSSPSGFPFNVVQLSGTMSDPNVTEARTRICDIGYLRHAYKTDRGTVAFRCPSEPVDTYVNRGGKIEDTAGRQCLCNGLMATVGLGQQHKWGQEPPIVTLGRNTDFIHDLIDNEQGSYTAMDALSYLLEKQPQEVGVRAVSKSRV
ncbi:MAG: nitronate monooxygenase [Dehalococcoidia bacterium]|nr:nitronate monooxygenase [Dehalococcoidia bacterium]